MKDQLKTQLLNRIRFCIWIMIIGLALSGITAFPIEAVNSTNHAYPFLSYGTDWLAFAHLMLAIMFLGPLKNPVKNKWVIEFGIIAALLIFPIAFIAGSIRGIPFYWQLIDCSFGIITLLVLLPCYKLVIKLENLR
jgi:hypothetical protein